MQHEVLNVMMFAIAFVLPVVLGFGASELFKGMAYGGAAAFLSALLFALLFDGWQGADSGTLQRALLNSMSVVPLSALLALAGYLFKRLLVYARQRDDQRTAG
jgi:hypothetical protein